MKVHRSLFGGAGNALENRKLLHFWARFIISCSNAITFLALLWLLFYADVKETSRDLVNILVGAYVAVLAKSTDYWFKDRKELGDEER
tara:strand:+ start:2050 stop:2313 length:264 start_codon:yes stop_codon:yes gene_type:complete